jgi:hypothetical protein
MIFGFQSSVESSEVELENLDNACMLGLNGGFARHECSEAHRCVPAFVDASVAFSNSNSSSVDFLGRFAFFARKFRRSATVKWSSR